MQITSEMLERFYSKLDSIETELKSLTKSLTVTIERHNVVSDNVDRIEQDLKDLGQSCRDCPARKSYDGKSFLVKDISAYLAIIISLVTLYMVFKGG